MRDVTIRPPLPGEGERLRDIAIAAKSYWGYEMDRVRRWATSVDLTDAGLRAKDFYVAEIAGSAVGWAALVPGDVACWLDDLWIEPEWIGRGVGRLLFQHAAGRARELGATRMEWEAEPNALGFYEKMGGRYARDSEPSAWGRVNPIMSVELLT